MGALPVLRRLSAISSGCWIRRIPVVWSRQANLRSCLSPPVPAATEARTLIEALEWHAAAHPERIHLTVIEDEATPIATFTYRGLRRPHGKLLKA